MNKSFATATLALLALASLERGGAAETPATAVATEASLQGRRVGILIADGFHGGETSQPIAYLRERGATVIPVGMALGTVRSGQLEYEIERTVAEPALADDLDALVIPGGSSPAALRKEPAVLDFVRRFAATGKLLAAICHGPQVLITAGLLDGRQATCVVVEATQYFAVRDELLKAGATYLNQPVVRDGNLLTSRLPDDLPLFNAALAAALQTQTPPKPAATTPAAWLKAQPKPSFRAGHTLPPLTRFGWTLDYDTRVELAENWGYALEFGGYVTFGSVARLQDPDSLEAKLAALAAADPQRYRLAVICSRELPPNDQVPATTWTRNADGQLLDGNAKSMDGTEWNPGMNSIYSPTAPDSVWQEAGRLRAEPLRQLREKAPIAIVLNGGEYGLGVLGFAQKVWEQDPAVLAAKGETPWYDYISARKAHAEMLIADAVRAAVPDRQLYIYYTAGGGTHRNRYGGWQAWAHGYEWMQPVSDLPSSESYYLHFNSGWTGDNDVLTQLLNARGFEIANQQPLAYNWLCAGWLRDKEGKETRHLSDIDTYKGFLACAYTAGMIGGNAGYYAYPPGGFAATFPADQPPHWLRQMVAFADVHARFSHLEDFLRDGDLLPGPNPHRWSKDQPAHEFPTGDPAIRVLARKLRDQPKWLITAWAADGAPRQAKVTIPELGELQLDARPAATVYLATPPATAGQTPTASEVEWP